MLPKILAFKIGFGIGWILSWNPEIWRRWQVIDGWEVRPVAEFFTANGARSYASELNEELMYQGWRPRYQTIHKAVTKTWRGGSE